MKLLSFLGRFIYKTFVIIELEARKLRHDPTELLLRAVQREALRQAEHLFASLLHRAFSGEL